MPTSNRNTKKFVNPYNIKSYEFMDFTFSSMVKKSYDFSYISTGMLVWKSKHFCGILSLWA